MSTLQQTVLFKGSSKKSGFTTLELLVATGLLGLVLSLVMQFFVTASSTTRTITNQAALQDELRTAAEIIGDEVQRAYYVFPPCGTYTGTVTPPVFTSCTSFTTPTVASMLNLNVTWSQFNIVTSGTRFKKPSGGYVWSVGSTTDPILAMISPPKNPAITCSNAVNTSRDGCFRFVAFFPVKRSGVTSSTTAAPRDFVNDDTENKDGWVLMEYRKNLDYNVAFNSPYTSLVVPGLGSLTSSGTTTDNFGKLTMTGFPTLSIPPINWLDAGCFSVDNNNSDCSLISNSTTTRLRDPSYDPAPSIQQTEGSLPRIQNLSNNTPIDLATFSARMQAVVNALELDSAPGTPRVLVDYIEPNAGFSIDFTQAGSVDQRGVTEVRLKLQGGIRQNGKVTVFPSQPVEVYATPRNIQ
jgi:type II secretory pathway pseudopilin PulG